MDKSIIISNSITDNKEARFVINLILLFIYPIFAFPYIITGIRRRELGAYVCLTLFMAMLAYLIIPTEAEDLSRIYENFETFRGLSWNQQLLLMGAKMDFLLSFMYVAVDKFHIAKEWIPFTSVTIGYLSYLMILHKWQRNHPLMQKSGIYINFFILFFCSVSFRNYAMNIRNFVAISCLMYGVYELYFKDNKRGWILICLAPICHIMTLLVLPFIFIARNNLISSNWCRRIFFISFIGFIINISAPINEYVTGFAFENESLQAEQATHFESGRYNDAATGGGYNTNGMISLVFGYFVTFVMYTYLFHFKRRDSQIGNLVYLLMALSNFLFHVSIMYGRYILVARTILLLFLLLEYSDVKEWKYKIGFLKLYSGLTFITFLMSMYSSRQSMENCLRIFYDSPIHFLFMS